MLKNKVGNKGIAYRQLVRERILQVLREEPRSFCELIKECDGAFPVEVSRQLAYLVRRGSVAKRGKEFALPGDTYREGGQSNFSSDPDRTFDRPHASLPPPHPVDFDWRFTSETRDRVVELLKSMVPEEGAIALLGVPSIFEQVRAVRPHALLVDRNRRTIESLSQRHEKTTVRLHDLFHPLGDLEGRFDFVFADPPWYLEFYKAFCLRGAEMLRTGGILAVSLLPQLTRPTAIEDRRKIFEFLQTIGFELTEERERFLYYELPSFERAALRESGIDCPGSWRSSELCLFRKVTEIEDFVVLDKPKDDYRWESFWIEQYEVKLRIRDERHRSEKLRIEPITIGKAVLRSVSRRSRRRPLIDLWTSDNLAYSVEGLDVLRFALRELQTKSDVDHVLQSTVRQFKLTQADTTALKQLLEDLVLHGKGAC